MVGKAQKGRERRLLIWSDPFAHVIGRVSVTIIESHDCFIAADNQKQIIAVRRIEGHDIQHIGGARLRRCLGESLLQISRRSD